MLALFALIGALAVAPPARADAWDDLFTSVGPPGMAAASTTPTTAPAPADPEAGSAVASWATTTPGVMHLTADYLEYDRGTGRVVLKGGGYVVQEDLELWADGLEVEMGSGRFYAAGKVRFRRPTEDLKGESLDYSYKLREGEMTDVVTWRGPNKVVAKKIAIQPAKLEATDLYTTSCDHDPPHYKVSARRGVLYPGDALILERAALNVKGKTLLRWPRYKANLKKANNSRFFLRPGWSQSRGFTVDSSYDFYFSDSEYGRILYNGTSDAGGSGGVAYRYGVGKDASGDVRLFHNETRVRNQNALRSNFLDQTSSSASWSHRHKLSEKSNVSFNSNYTTNDVPGLGDNEELNVGVTFDQQVPDWNLRMQVQRRIDADGSKFTLDDQQPFVNQSPVLSFQKIAPLRFGRGFEMRVDGLWGRYAERATAGPIAAVNKGELNLRLAGPAIEAGRTVLRWTFDEKLNWYSNGDKRDYYALTLNGQTPMGKEFEASYNYTLQRESGQTPFARLDQLADAQIVSLFLRQRKGNIFNATWLELSRDLDRGIYTRAASNLFWHSPGGVRTPWSFGLNFGYEFKGDRELSDLSLRSISTNTRFGRNNWRHQLITNYDKTTGKLASFSTGSDFRLDEKWRVQLLTNWGRGGIRGDLERNRLALALTRDLHAWEAKLRWDVEQKEVFLEFYLKHSSRRKLGLRADYDLGLDLDPFLGERANRPGPLITEVPAP